MKIFTLNNFVILLSFLFLLFGCSSDNKKGWRTYRHDGFRSGVTAETLPKNLTQKWVYMPAHAPASAWHKPGEELPRMHVDNTYHLVSANGLTYFASSIDDKIYALNTVTGAIKWSFFAGGPIRFVPSIWKDKILFGSDDGYVYCLDAGSGDLIWKYRAGPSGKKVLGNGRMISLWPVRTSVLVEKDVVYFGAGIFPYEGIYICALDVASGEVVWKNDTIGDKAHELQFGGISPHGYLLASEETIYVPSGRAMPAAFDRRSGKFLYNLSPGSKVGGAWGLINENMLIAGVDRSGTPAKVAYDLASGRRKGDAFVSFDGIDMVARKNISYVLTETGIHAIDREKYPIIEKDVDSLLTEIKKTNGSLRKLAQTGLEQKDDSNKDFDKFINKIELLKQEKDAIQGSATKWQFKEDNLNTIILTKNKVIAGGKGIILVLDANNGSELNRFRTSGDILGFAVSDGHLLANDEKGNIYCFSGDKGSKLNKSESLKTVAYFENDELNEVYKTAAEQIIKETGVKRGFCLVLNSSDGRLAYELAKQSDLKIIGVEKDEEKVAQSRVNLDAAGIYGERIAVENWSLDDLPDYFANLIVSDDLLISGNVSIEPKDIKRVLKPFGGMVCLGQTDINRNTDSQIETDLVALVRQIGAGEPQVSHEKGLWVKIKRGALEGAGSWTHQYSNPANTICSDDELVNYPFGVLWFGEPGPEKMVERHARAAAPLAKNGRLFVQGEDVVMAYDSYNGLKLWEREIQGANRVRVDVDGSNLALSDHGIFVATGENCLLLDAETGQTLQTYKIPTSKDGKPRRWGYIACSGETLYGSAAKPFDEAYNHILKSSNFAENNDQTDQDAFLASQYATMEEADYEFQRSGTKWRFIADYPAWNGGIVTQEAATEKIMFSDAIFAMDITSGKTNWLYRGKKIAHIAISMGDGNLYFADNSVTPAQKSQGVAERKNYAKKAVWKKYTKPLKTKDIDVRLVTVLNARTGNIKWQRPIDLSGCGGDAVASAYKNNTLLFFGSFGLHDKWRFEAEELRWHRITALSSENGKMLWSRPLNYMVRPVIVNETVIVEPRACDLRTGEIKTRVHPVTGQTVPWEYFRPGHTCAVTSATSSCLFYRSYNAAFYDLAGDRGITYFGAIRPGCWINMIPANGLLLFPEASAGCTCSFPLRTTVVLKPAEKKETADWSVFVNQGPITPVKRLGINFGAPGDKKDDKGELWFGYPRPITGYGIRFDLKEKVTPNMGYFSYDTRGLEVKGTDKPWLYTSGCLGLSSCKIPLIDEAWSVKSSVYTVRVGFYVNSGDHIFDIKLQNKTVLENFDPMDETSSDKEVVIKEFKGIEVENDLMLELVSDKTAPKMDEAPVINFVEIVREEDEVVFKIEDKGFVLSGTNFNGLLKKGDKERLAGDNETALDLYHRVFKQSPSTKTKEKALKGMAAIGSPESLPVIENTVRQTSPIYWDYKEPDPAFIDEAISVYVAIANNLAPSNPKKAKIMLANAAEVANGFDLKDEILENLVSLGVDFENTSATPENLSPGIRYDFFEGNFTSVAGLDIAKVKSSGVVKEFKLQQPEGVSEYGYIFSGYLSVPENGIYTFYIESNDGSKLYINNKELINNDGGHGAKEELGNIALRRGYYPIAVKYFQMGGGQALKVSWESADFKKKEISAENVYYAP